MIESQGLRLALSIACLAGVVAATSARALDYPTVAREVVAANPRLEAKRAMAEAARRRVGPVGAWPSPMLQLGVENVPTTGRFDEDAMTMKVIGATQRVPLFGRTGLARASARAAAEAERAGLRRTTYEIQATALEAYADAYYASVLADHGLRHQEQMHRLVRSARSRYEVGKGRLDDVLRAEAERARMLADIAMFRAEENAARARLDALRGVAPGSARDTLAPPPIGAIPPLDAWRAGIASTHPRLAEAEAVARRYRLAARASRRMVLPDLELSAKYQFRSPLHGIDHDDMFSAMVGFMVPIFAGSRELAEGAEMDAMARASDADRRAAELEIAEEVSVAHAQAEAALRTVALFADTVLTTQNRAVEASWVSYTAGTTDLWRVLEATHALYDEEVALIRARQELARAVARLVATTGRGDLVGIALSQDEGNER